MKKFLAIFLIFFLLFGFCVPAFAADFPDPSPDWGSYIIVDGVLSHYESSYPHSRFAVFSSREGLDYSVSLNNDNIVSNIYLGSDNVVGTGLIYYAFSVYTPDSSGIYTWKMLGSSSFYPSDTYVSIMNDNFSSFIFNDYSSSSVVYIYGTDEVFTPPPNLEKVTGEALTQFQNQTIQTVLTLVLCGVGCLGLLISLVLLRKVYFHFLNK